MLALSHTGTLWIRHIPQSTRIIVPSRTIGINSQKLLIFFKTMSGFQHLCYVSFLSNLPFPHCSIALLDSSLSQVLPSRNTVFSAPNSHLVIHFVFCPLRTTFSSELPLSLWLFLNDKILLWYATSWLVQSYICPKHIWTLNVPLYFSFIILKKNVISYS